MRAAAVASFTILSTALIGAAMQIGDKDASTLVDQATKRMDGAIAYFRKTGNVADIKGELAFAESELSNAYRSLSKAAHNSKATLGLLRGADCLRMLQRWAEARERYRTAADLARQANEAEYQVKAWFGIEKVERIGLKNTGAASDALNHALDISHLASLQALEANLLAERAELELSSGNPSLALKTIDSVIDTAQKWVTRICCSGLYIPALISNIRSLILCTKPTPTCRIRLRRNGNAVRLSKTRNMRHRRETFELLIGQNSVELSPDAELLRISANKEISTVSVRLFLHAENDIQRQYNQEICSSIESTLAPNVILDVPSRLDLKSLPGLGAASGVNYFSRSLR